MWRMPIAIVLVILVAAMLNVPVIAAAPDYGSVAFEQVWNRVDRPVARHQVERTWVWGPGPMTEMFVEPYVEGRVAGRSGGRRVLYFDKGRMEITGTSVDGSPNSSVSSGLLTWELITGRMQLGDESFADFEPAQIPIVGDQEMSTVPTYAEIAPLMTYDPIPVGWTINQTLNGNGEVGHNASFERHGVTTVVHVPETDHTVASVFWDFMNSSGVVDNGRENVTDYLFESPFAATGLPITEAYWTTVEVGGASRDVLVQAFQRRILTYTPGNPPAWQVELGNVGQHYYQWRYGSDQGDALRTTSVYWRRSSDGGWIVLGEVANETRSALATVEVTVDLFAQGGEFVASQSRYLDLSSIGPGERLPFRVWFDPGVEFDRYDIRYRYDVSAEHERAPLTTTAESMEETDSGLVRVAATVQNNGGNTLAESEYVVALYDQHGRVVDYIAGFIDHPTLEPGQSASIVETFYAAPPDVVEQRIFLTD